MMMTMLLLLLSMAYPVVYLSILSLYRPYASPIFQFVIIGIPPISLVMGIFWCSVLYSEHYILAMFLTLILIGVMYMSMYMAKNMLDNFQPAQKEAVEILLSGLANERIEQIPVYQDYVYLPPPPPAPLDHKKNAQGEDGDVVVTEERHALILFPGALVDPIAVAGIASQLSDRGIVVVVPNTEPYRLPSTLLKNANLTHMTCILKYVERKYGGKNNKRKKKIQWSTGGHSMGTYPAAAWAQYFGSNKVILCGTYKWNGSVDLLSSKVLCLGATNDGFYTSKSTHELEQKFQSMLPPDEEQINKKLHASSSWTRYRWIKGGNHSGFAHYGPHTFMKVDGERTISLQEQHEQIVEEIAKFLLLDRNELNRSDE